jgi:probable phosphoglycerate mutase
VLIYLVRHGRTSSSAIDSFNGQRELPLTEEGREQAKKLRARLAEVRWGAVYCSPLGRTAETAHVLAPDAKVVELPGLIEINYGKWEGLTALQAEALDTPAYAAWVADPVANAPPGGETAAQVAERALQALEKIRARHEASKGPVLAVSHKAR